jgi:hypothetical protein
MIAQLHHPGTSLPPIRPSDPPNGSDTKSTWTPEELYCITGCCRFCNYRHIIDATKDGHLLDTGEFPISLGSYMTIPKAPRGKPIDRMPSFYLNIVHVDVAFGDCVSVGGNKNALVLVDRATRYNWMFGLKSLHHDDILVAFWEFRDEAGSLAWQFRCVCNEKLFGSSIRSFLHSNRSLIVSGPAGRQSGNGLVKAHWKIMVHMSRAYLTEKQMPRSFWYFAICHAASMMNVIPGKYNGKLTSPFMLVHGERPDQQAWLPIFSLCYFHHENDSNASRSKNQANTLDGIIIGRDPTSTAILVYNPRNQKYYKPDSYRINPYRLPSLVYSTVKYDSGLFISLHRDKIASISEPFHSGTRVAKVHPTSGRTLLGTIMDIPLDPNMSPHYLILFDDGTSSSIPAADMPDLIPKPSIDVSVNIHLLPPFLRLVLKSHSTKTGNIIKAIFLASPTVPIDSAINPTSIRNGRTGVSLSPTLQQGGRISAQRASFSLVTAGLHLIAQRPPSTLVHAILYVTARGHSYPLSILTIRTERCGLRVFAKKNVALNPSTPTTKFCSLSTALFVRREPLVPFRLCASSLSRRTK